MKSKKHSSKKDSVKKLLASVFTVFLILTMFSPTFAVVFSNTTAITANDATAVGIGNPYPSNIEVAGLSGNITNITVSLNNFNSTFPDDIDILLVAPNGNNIILLSDAGGANDIFFTNLTFSDAATAGLSDAGLIASGTYLPTNIGTGDTFPAPAPAPGTNTTLAAAFGGIAANGTWSLYVVDDTGIDMTTIGNGWTITITTTGSTATDFTNDAPIHAGDGGRGRATPYPSTITASGLTGAITDVNVTLTGINHLNPDDLDIMLIGPSGKRILLMSDAGGTADVVAQNITFDDSAAAILADAGPLATGTFRPTNIGAGDTMPDFLPPYPNSATAGGATLASVFNGTDGNGTWQLVVVDDATGGGTTNNIMGGWSIDITAGGTFGAKRFTSADFDGDGKTDMGVFRGSNAFWYLRDNNTLNNRYINFGSGGNDLPVPGDYDGDRRHDLAVIRVSGAFGTPLSWFILNSSTNTLQTIQFGTPTDRAVPQDYDGDGRYDVAVYRPGDGNWYIRNSNNGAAPTFRAVQWGGQTGDIPVRGHFNGRDTADIGIYRPTDNTWYIAPNPQGDSSYAVQFGTSGDLVVPGNYDGDTRTDIAVFRQSSGTWYILQSSTQTAIGRTWGAAGDRPAPGDYDGDSVTDLAVYRAGTWYILNSGTPPGTAALRIDYWGAGGDLPLANLYHQAVP